MEDLLYDLVVTYNKFLKEKHTFTVGLSGGVDSVVVLFSFYELMKKLPIKVSAVHINHGISKNAGSWEEFCIDLCKRLGIVLKVKRCVIRKFGGESLENNARKLRHSIFREDDSDVIVLAHHKNDQIETMLSQILRGSDIHNIGSMSEMTMRSGKLYWRPFLGKTRKYIEDIASKYDIAYVVDESNYNTKYLRNFVRYNLLPKVVEWDSDIFNKLANIVPLVQESNALLDELALCDLNLVKSSNMAELLVDKFNLLSDLRQVNLLYFFLRSFSLMLPSKKKIKEFCRQVREARWDRHPLLRIKAGCFLYKSRNQIKIVDKIVS